jgi:hypothetical protein
VIDRSSRCPDRGEALDLDGVRRGESVAGVGCETEPAAIAARYGFEKGVWFHITEGIHGLLVRVPEGEPVVYMVCEPSTRYFRVMTRSDRMPWLIGEAI